MKYIVMIGDGMADFPLPERDNKTPLELANIPCMDRIASEGELGIVRTIPIGCPPGSDTGNLSIMGYNPAAVYTGRSPLEAVSLGVDMSSTDIAFRCNLVTVSDAENFDDRIMITHSGSGITDDEARIIVKDLNDFFAQDGLSFTFGASYRHVVIADGAGLDAQKIVTHAPHDNLDKALGGILPDGPLSEKLADCIKRSIPFLENHPVNLDRAARGLGKANCIWFWGEGRKPDLEPLTDSTGLTGSIISAVPLLHGIGQLAGLRSIYVEGATADLHTNYEGKMQAALDAIHAGDDIVIIHVEAPDECSHDGDTDGKIYSVEQIDEKILTPLMDTLEKEGVDYRLLLMPDHGTTLCTRTHDAEPIPYALYDSTCKREGQPRAYSETSAKTADKWIDDGYTLIYRLLQRA